MAYLLLTASNAGCLSIGRRVRVPDFSVCSAPDEIYGTRDGLFFAPGCYPPENARRSFQRLFPERQCDSDSTAPPSVPFPVECDRYQQLATLLSSWQHIGGLMINCIRTRIIFNVRIRRRREPCPSVDRRMAQKNCKTIKRNILPCLLHVDLDIYINYFN